MEKKKRDFGRRLRITTYVEKPMYDALLSVAEPEEDERWEARIMRKALSEFLEKRGVQWKEPTAAIDGPDNTKDVVRPARKPAAKRG